MGRRTCAALTVALAATAILRPATLAGRDQPPAGGGSLTVPAGTILKASLRNAVGTNFSVVGDRAEATLIDPILVARDLAPPGGTRLNGYVRDVKKPGRVKGRGAIELVFTEAELPGGVRTSLHAGWATTAPGTTRRDAWIIGGAAAGGALLGQIIGGDSEKTVEGAAVGGAVGTGVVLPNKGRDVMLRERTILIMETRTPISVPAGG